MCAWLNLVVCNGGGFGRRYYCDAALTATGQRCAVAVVVRDTSERILVAASRQLNEMTSNEAEYEAFILGLQLALRQGEPQPVFLLDSQIVVGQIAGCFAVRDEKLRPRHAHAAHLLAQVPAATVVFVPREYNRLADALAKEALNGSVFPMSLSEVNQEGGSR